jgi:Xaa-Pro aminopeptidase
MGVISHETPRLARNFSYPPDDATLPLKRGMVLSVETAIKHPKRGFIKIEDTLAITHSGRIEAYGDAGRTWNRGPA